MPTSRPAVQSINVGGLAVDVFSMMSWQEPSRGDNNNLSLASSIASSSLPITALIILHGRLATKESSRPIAENALQYAHDMTTQAANNLDPSSVTHELIVVTLVCVLVTLCIPARLDQSLLRNVSFEIFSRIIGITELELSMHSLTKDGTENRIDIMYAMRTLQDYLEFVCFVKIGVE